MTELRITPNLDKKSAKFHGTIAAGERVHIVIQSDVAFGDNLRFRAVSVGGKTLAQFPYDDEYKWDIVDGAYECDLNLNTVQMLEVVPAGATVPILFVLDDAVENTLYFKDFTNVTHWPRKEGEDIPVDLSGYVDYYKEIQDNISSIESQIAKKAEATALEDEVSRAQRAEAALGKAIDTKVDAVEGMGLSSNDYTAEEKEKLGKAYSPDNPPPIPNLEEYAKTEEVESALEGKVARGENLFAYGEDGYPISPDLFTFYGQSAPGVAIYGAVGLDGFTMERMATNFVGAIKIDFDSYSGVPRILLDDSYGGGLVLDSRHIKTNTVQANYVAGVGDLGVEGVQNIQFSPDSAISYYKDDGNFLYGPVPPLVDMANGSYYGESFYFGGNLEFGSKAPSFKFEPGPGGVYDKSLYLTDIYDAVYGYTFIRYGENYDIETEDENSLAFTIVGYDDGSSFECSLGSRVIGFSNKFVGTAYLSWSGLGIYDDETGSSMTLSASSIGFWDAENGTDLIFSLGEFRAAKQMVNALNKTTIDHFEGINVSDMTQEQKSEILNFFVTEYFNAKKSLKGMG